MSMAQILRLKPAFTDEQAQALAGLFDEEIATKRDIEVLRHDIELVKLDVERFRAELKADIEKLRLEVQRDIKGVEAHLVRWMFGQGIAVIGVLFTLLHFVEK